MRIVIIAALGVFAIAAVVAFFFLSKPTTFDAPITEAYYERGDPGYGLYLDWGALPQIRYRIDAPNEQALDRIEIKVDGRVVADSSGISGQSASGTFQYMGAAPDVAELAMWDDAGGRKSWIYDFRRARAYHAGRP